jgi:hypothetical protein
LRTEEAGFGGGREEGVGARSTLAATRSESSAGFGPAASGSVRIPPLTESAITNNIMVSRLREGCRGRADDVAGGIPRC